MPRVSIIPFLDSYRVPIILVLESLGPRFLMLASTKVGDYRKHRDFWMYTEYGSHRVFLVGPCFYLFGASNPFFLESVFGEIRNAVFAVRRDP